MQEPCKYTLKRVEVTAMQYVGENHDVMRLWMNTRFLNTSSTVREDRQGYPLYIVVDSVHRLRVRAATVVEIGSWVVDYEDATFDVLNDVDFKRLYGERPILKDEG